MVPLKNLLSHGTFRTVYCVIDGLDVYKTGMKQLVENLAKLFDTNSENRISYLKLFCTSRPTSDLSPMLEKLPCRILRSHREDLEIFLQSHVESMSSDVSQDIKDVIITERQESVGQTFLWVAIILRKILYLAASRTTLQRMDVLNEIKYSGKELENLYRDLVLEAINRDPQNAAIFTWVAFAREPLSIGALSEAISVRRKDSSMLTVDIVERKLGTLLDVIQN